MTLLNEKLARFREYFKDDIHAIVDDPNDPRVGLITMDLMEKFIRDLVSTIRSHDLQAIKDYQHGFIRDDGTGEPERAPEWQVIEDLLVALQEKLGGEV